MEALSKLLKPEDVKEVAAAIEAQLNEAKAQLEKEYETKLEEAYAQLAEEVKKNDAVGEQGYQEAYGIITDLRNRLDTQKAEYESHMEEQFEEAFQMLQAEKGKNETLEKELYEQYDKKLQEMKEFFIDKIDEFLSVKGQEIYETCRRDIVNDPRMVEHKVALSKIVETVSDYISADEYNTVTSSKVSDLQKQIDDLKGNNRMLEARNIRLATENNKLNEQVRQSADVLKEHAEASKTNEKEERVEKAKNVQGRGKAVTENVEVIGENKDQKAAEPVVTENTENDDFHDWQVLSGIKK